MWYDAEIAEQCGIDEGGFRAMKTGNFVFQNENTLENIRSLIWKSNKVSFEKIDKYFKGVPISLGLFGRFQRHIIFKVFSDYG